MPATAKSLFGCAAGRWAIEIGDLSEKPVLFLGHELVCHLLSLAALLLPVQILVCNFLPTTNLGYSDRVPTNAVQPSSADWPTGTGSSATGNEPFDSRGPIAASTAPNFHSVTRGATNAELSSSISELETESNGRNAIATIFDLHWIRTTLFASGIIYLIGVAGFIAFLVMRIGSTVRLVFRSRTVDNSDLSLIAEPIVGRNVQLKTSGELSSPPCLIFPRPMVILPDGLADSLDADQLECVLSHEPVHLNRHDWVVDWLEELLKISMWFHPAA